jgi:AcrR family transcriptional regulator
VPASIKRGRGRRPGTNQTRQAVLAAARAHFAAKGYDGATVRAIAQAADVDPALVLQFYGSKEQLFDSAAQLPFEPDEVEQGVLQGPRAQLGERFARFFLAIWDVPERREPMMALLRAATTSQQAADLLRESLSRTVFAPIAGHLGGADAPLRLSLCGSQLVGLGIARYVVSLEPLASLERDEVVALIAPTLQRYLTRPL